MIEARKMARRTELVTTPKGHQQTAVMERGEQFIKFEGMRVILLKRRSSDLLRNVVLYAKASGSYRGA